MRGIVRDIVIKGVASGLSSALLRADLSRLMLNAQRLGGLDDHQVAELRREVEERLHRAEAEGREQRELLSQVLRELVLSWLPRGGRTGGEP
ncbi:MAG: hypothetical protein FJ098_02285 [Deltaproteobacteria bacterium]|nr:hypothetical protein [Deltaproteobacteria bacterium]